MGKERGREGEKYQCVVAPGTPPTGDLAHNPGMCPDWESNQRPFGSQSMLNPPNYSSQGQNFDCNCRDGPSHSALSLHQSASLSWDLK